MSGVIDLSELLRSACPVLTEPEYVFVTVTEDSRIPHLDAICTFREREAMTIICPKSKAEAAGLTFDRVYREIELNVHSSLEAVGFLAAVAAALSREKIPCNVVSAYYHDHIFVPAELAGRAVEALSRLSLSSTKA
jgi:hypothetical protein